MSDRKKKAINLGALHDYDDLRITELQRKVANLEADDTRQVEVNEELMQKDASQDGVIANIDSRLETVEELAEISVGGGDIQIATAADFDSDTPASRAKVPTVGAIQDNTDDEPVQNSEKFVKSGGVAKVNSTFLQKSQLGKHLHPVKNLININDLLYGKIVSDGDWVDSESGICTNKIMFKGGVTYAMQGIGCYGVLEDIYIAYFDANDTYLGRKRISATLDDPQVKRGKAVFTYSNSEYEGIAYCRVILQSQTSAHLDTSLCQIEVGSQYTSVVGFEEIVNIDYISMEEAEALVNPINNEIDVITDALSYTEYDPIEPTIYENHRVNGSAPSGIEVLESNLTDIWKYSGIVAGNVYAFSNRQKKGYNTYVCYWFNDNDECIKVEPYHGTSGQVDLWEDVEIIAPENATQLWMNVNHNSVSYASVKTVTKELIKSVDLEKMIENIDAQHKKTIRLLSIGNSYSQDALAYVPFILQNMGVDVDFQIGIAMLSSSSLSDHVINFENEEAVYSYELYDGGPEWKRYGRDGDPKKTLQQILDDKTWDIICLQQSSGGVFNWATYQPNLNKLINDITGYVSNPVKFGWYAVQARPAKTNSGANWSDEVITQHFEAICENAEKVMDETVCEFLVPVNTAIQNARSIASLKALGAYASNENNTSGLGYLTPNDGVHLQEGLPCQIAAYTFVLKLLDIYGFDEYSINAEGTRVTAEWAAGKNIPGPHGDYIGSTDENCHIAQKCAIMAIKKPYEMTDMNYIVNPT